MARQLLNIACLLAMCTVTAYSADLMCYTCPPGQENIGCQFSEVKSSSCIVAARDSWPRCAYHAMPDPKLMKSIFIQAADLANNNTRVSQQEIDRCANAILMEMNSVLTLELPKKDRYLCTNATYCGSSFLTNHILSVIVGQCNKTYFFESFEQLTRLDLYVATVCCNQDNCNAGPVKATSAGNQISQFQLGTALSVVGSLAIAGAQWKNS